MTTNLPICGDLAPLLLEPVGVAWRARPPAVCVLAHSHEGEWHEAEDGMRWNAPSIYNEVDAERRRAHAKHRDNSIEFPGHTDERRLAILVEEVGEAAHELNDAVIDGRLPDKEKLRTELIQVAAMACAWAEQLR